MRMLAGYLFALCLMLALPGQASAYYVRVEAGVIRYDADYGETDILVVERTDDGYRLGQTAYSMSNPRIGPGCREQNFVRRPGVVCDAAGVSAVVAALGDQDDVLIFGPTDVPVVYSGGDGVDRAAAMGATTSGGPSLPGPVVMTNDGVADDGPLRQDNVMADVEVLDGSLGADVLGAGPNGTVFNLEGGDDRAAGGPADDVVRAARWGSGNDPSLPDSLHTEGRDTVTCGAGRDAVMADAGDIVAADCEVVGRPRNGPIVRGQPGYELRGTSTSDTIVLSRIIDQDWAPILVRGGGGDDTLIGGAVVSGGAGSDRLITWDGHRQWLRGDSGNDRIDARDSPPVKRANDDSIRCGPGRDTVYADRTDWVSTDCERIRR